MSKSCNHFLVLSGDKRGLKIKNFRDTYMTQLKKVTGGSAISISQHSSESVLDKHYYDLLDIAIEVAKSDFRIFPE